MGKILWIQNLDLRFRHPRNKRGKILWIQNLDLRFRDPRSKIESGALDLEAQLNLPVFGINDD